MKVCLPILALLLTLAIAGAARAECPCGPSCRCTPAAHCGCLAVKCGGGGGASRGLFGRRVPTVTYSAPIVMYQTPNAPPAYRMVCEGGVCKLVPVNRPAYWSAVR